MGYNMMVAIAPGSGLSALESAGASLGGTITGDAAMSLMNDEVAAVERDGNLVLLTGGHELMLVLPQVAAAATGPVYTGWFGSTADTWLWQVDSDGGRRRWVSSFGETVEDEGTPDAAEAGVQTLDEDGLFTLLQTATGFAADAELMNAECRVVSFPSLL